MITNENSLRGLYESFNEQDVESILAMMAEDVEWANGMEGGFVYGRGNVREYWRRQFELIKAELTPLEFEIGENTSAVKLRQVIRDLSGNLLDDKIAEHIFTFENGLIKTFEIGNFTKPFTDNENFRKLRNNA